MYVCKHIRQEVQVYVTIKLKGLVLFIAVNTIKYRYGRPQISKTTCDWSAICKQRLLICPRYVYFVPQPKTLAGCSEEGTNCCGRHNMGSLLAKMELP